MECMRFSASSKTRERSDSKTSSVTSSSGRPNFWKTSSPMVVLPEQSELSELPYLSELSDLPETNDLSEADGTTDPTDRIGEYFDEDDEEIGDEEFFLGDNSDEEEVAR